MPTINCSIMVKNKKTAASNFWENWEGVTYFTEDGRRIGIKPEDNEDRYFIGFVTPLKKKVKSDKK